MIARFLCFIGIHRWIPAGAKPGFGQHCVRSPHCRYHGMYFNG